MAPRFSFVYKAMFCFFSYQYILQIVYLKKKWIKQSNVFQFKSNINRLACFDKVFNTPVREQ